MDEWLGIDKQVSNLRLHGYEDHSCSYPIGSYLKIDEWLGIDNGMAYFEITELGAAIAEKESLFCIHSVFYFFGQIANSFIYAL